MATTSVEDVLDRVDGLRRDAADRVQDRFATVGALASATTEQLTEIRGIGAVMAERIHAAAAAAKGGAASAAGGATTAGGASGAPAGDGGTGSRVGRVVETATGTARTVVETATGTARTVAERATKPARKVVDRVVKRGR